MVGIKRRKKVEGWAEDVTDAQGGMNNPGLRQRIADNNKLWLLCLVVIVGLTVFFIKGASQESDLNTTEELPVADLSQYDAEVYSEFAQDFASDPDYSDILVETPQFSGPERFKLVVPGDVSRDDIEYTSRMAARLIGHRFNHRVVVQVFMQRANGDKTMIADAMWKPEKGYVVSFRDEADGFL